MNNRDHIEARLSHPAAQVVMRLLVTYAKRAARAYALCRDTTEPGWSAYYGLACAEEALRDVLCGYVQHGYLFIAENLRNEQMHVGQGPAAVAECKRAADALVEALRKAGLDERGEPMRAPARHP
jgi:hypothetical protein